jgi:adenine-specific DNA-methyltransferase
MIYIDPPYNTGNDFVYADDFKDPLERYREVTQQTTKSNPESMGRFHTNWLNMMWPRLRLAANLLKDDGVIFISIDDGEVRNLRIICDEIFGEENFVANIIWQKKTGASDAVTIATITEYIVVYAKSINNVRFAKNTESYDLNRYKYTDEFEQDRGPYYIDNLDRGGLQYSDSLNYGIECPDGTITFPNGRTEYVNDGWIWKWSKAKIEWARENKFIEFRKSNSKQSGWSVCYKNYLKVDNENKPIERAAPHKNLITDVMNANAAAVMKDLFKTNNYFDYAKPLDLIKKFISFIKFSDNDIILDFFSGSATTAHAVMQLNAEDGGNRRFILVQLPELTPENSEANKAGYKNICEIGKERIRRAGAKIKAENALTAPNSDTGFRVFRLDSSNLKVWNETVIIGENRVEIMQQRILEMLEILKPDRTDLDVVYEVMLKLGQDLCEPIIPIELPENRQIYGVGADVTFIVCLAKNISPEDAEIMSDYAPGRIIFADQCFNNSTDKSNVKLTLRDKGITIKVL